jgi:hypothetical protein
MLALNRSLLRVLSMKNVDEKVLTQYSYRDMTAKRIVERMNEAIAMQW